MKKRLDTLVAHQHPAYSKTQIQTWIRAGCVMVDDKIIQKPGMLVDEHARIVLHAETPKHVSRAGLKLEAALTAFKIDVTNLVALDAGLSTGGFTDCLLQQGVAKVYGVDVGHGQVHEKIRHDPRVVVMEGVNLRTLQQLPLDTSTYAQATVDTRGERSIPAARGECPPEPWRRLGVSNHAAQLVDLVTLDLSFISVLKVMDAVTKLLKPNGALIVLIKPQFEAGKEHVGTGGIVKDAAVHQNVVQNVVAGIVAHGFTHHGTIESPVASDNKEFLAYFTKT